MHQEIISLEMQLIPHLVFMSGEKWILEKP
jgi:hypothetical protein